VYLRHIHDTVALLVKCSLVNKSVQREARTAANLLVLRQAHSSVAGTRIVDPIVDLLLHLILVTLGETIRVVALGTQRALD